jgi:hypothetical protein
MRRIHRVVYNTGILRSKEITVLGSARSIISIVQVILDVFSPDSLRNLLVYEVLLNTEDSTLKICYGMKRIKQWYENLQEHSTHLIVVACRTTSSC